MWEQILAFLNNFSANPAPVVAVVRLAGVIAPNSRTTKSINLENTEKLLTTAFSLRGVKAVVLIINSPGGSPVQSALILDRIRNLAKDKDISVLTFCEDVAASGGYMLALAGDEIYAHEASILGSIGVVYSGFGFDKVLDKFGVERRLYTSGEQKSLLDPFSPEKKEDVKRLQHIQGEIHEYFKSKVRERRGKRLKGPKAKVFSGDVWLGKEAQKLGLIDDTADMRTFLKDRFGDRVRVRTIKPKKEPFGLLSMLRGIDSKSDVSVSSGGSWSDDVLDTIETRSYWDRWGL